MRLCRLAVVTIIVCGGACFGQAPPVSYDFVTPATRRRANVLDLRGLSPAMPSALARAPLTASRWGPIISTGLQPNK